jgi:hypothetical protein
VRQALCAALADEVTDFYRLMAVLETQLTVPQPMPGAVGVPVRATGCSGCSTGSELMGLHHAGVQVAGVNSQEL